MVLLTLYIGTTNPTAKLHIGGTAGVDGIKFPDGTLQTTAAAIVAMAKRQFPPIFNQFANESYIDDGNLSTAINYGPAGLGYYDVIYDLGSTRHFFIWIYAGRLSTKSVCVIIGNIGLIKKISKYIGLCQIHKVSMSKHIWDSLCSSIYL